MNYELNITSDADLISDELLGELKIAAQDAMAIAFSDIVLKNFGEEGINRPTDWAYLTPNYAEEFHEGDRTPTLVLSGDLRAATNVELGNQDHASCYNDSDYAAEQQFGNPSKNLPARPFFPIVGTIDDFELTDYAADKCFESAQSAIMEVLK